MRKQRQTPTFSKTPPPRPSSTPIRRPTTSSATLLGLQPADGDSVPAHLRKWAATPATTSGIPHRISGDSVSQSLQSQKPVQSISDSSYSSFAFLAASSSAPQPSVDNDNSTFTGSIPARERQRSNPSPQSHSQRRLPTQTRARRHHSLQHDSPPSSSQARLQPSRDRDRDRGRDVVNPAPTGTDGINTNPATGSTSTANAFGLTASPPPTPTRALRSRTEIANAPRTDNLLERARRVFSLPSSGKTRRRSQTPPMPSTDSFGAELPPHLPAVPNEGASSSRNMRASLEAGQNVSSRDSGSIETRAHGGGESCSTLGTAGGKTNVTSNRDSIVGEGATRRLSTPGTTGTSGGGTAGGIASRSARKAVRVLSGRTGNTGGQTSNRASDSSGTAGSAPGPSGTEGDGDTTEALQVRVRILENELEASRVRMARQRKRIQQLEDESSLSRQALPALETIIKSALAHFDAKEAALKHTITKIHQEMATVVAEKNEALRLLATFVGRSARSPPPSFSSISEAGADLTAIGGRDGRRSGSASSGAGRRSSLMDHSFEVVGSASMHARSGDAGDTRGGVTTR